MEKIHQLYTKQIYDNLKYRPTWLPGKPISLGSVGPIKDGTFDPITSLDNLNLPFEVILDFERDSIDYSSKTGVSIILKGAGDANPKFEVVASACAGALVEFTRIGGVVLQLRGVAHHRIANQPALYKQLLRSVVIGNEDDWQRDWVVITEVVHAEYATIIISDSANSKLELKASGSLLPTSLVDVSAGFIDARVSDVSVKVIAETGLTPLYRGVRVTKGFLWLFNEVQPACSDNLNADDVFGEAVPEEDVDFIVSGQ